VGPYWLPPGIEVNPLAARGHDEIAAFMACASRFPWSLLTLDMVPAISGTVDYSITLPVTIKP
jgi:hypothetical protein